MKFLLKIVKYVKGFFLQYPAVLSGYVIYSYLFVTIMHYYVKAQSGALGFYDIFETFSAIPFMWFLSVALVKIIDVRSKFHESERKRILTEKELEIHQTQLQTMKETVRALQHHINNPLSVIQLSVDAVRKVTQENREINHPLSMAENSVSRIHHALCDFSNAYQYKTENIDSFCGKMASLKSMTQSIQ